MLDTKVFTESWDVNQRLAALGVTKADILEVVHQAISARNDAVAIYPVNAPGLLAYIYGTGAIRSVLLRKGWKIDRTDNIEGTINPVNGVKLIYQNTDIACDPERNPKAVSGKGSASERMVNMSGYLFPEMEEEDRHNSASSIWFICVAVTPSGICAELSCPRSIEGKQFFDFDERIFIVNPGEFDDFGLDSEDNSTDEQEFEVKISRK